MACLFDEGGLCHKVKGSIRKDNCDRLTTGLSVGQPKGDLGIGIQECVAVGVIDKVESRLGVQCETKGFLECIACVVGKPNVWVCRVDEYVDGV